MNATKRKFNALLNGIGNKSSTSVNSKEVNNDSSTPSLLTKKRRTTPNNTNASPQKSHRITSLSISKHKKSHSVAVAASSDEPPKYAPWDRTEFLRRLETFKSITDWTPKPRKVDEVEWAKRGWVCKGKERVRCGTCGSELVVKLNKKEKVGGGEEEVLVASQIKEELVDKYVELIITSHGEDCLWRQRGCDDAIFKLPLNHAQTTIQGIRERYEELKTRSENLPYLHDLRTPPELDLDLVVKYLPENFFKTPNQNASTAGPEVNKVALTLSLCGWQSHTHPRLGPQPGSISCHACFRVLGLWLFKSKEVNSQGERVISAAMNCLDVVKEHREYCPWRNAISQNGSKAASPGKVLLAGWETVLRVLRNDHFLKNGGDVAELEKGRPVTSGDVGAGGGGEEDKKAEEARDKERWARLRRVKSLFDTKRGKGRGGDVKSVAL